MKYFEGQARILTPTSIQNTTFKAPGTEAIVEFSTDGQVPLKFNRTNSDCL
jgi:hypothetical protein